MIFVSYYKKSGSYTFSVVLGQVFLSQFYQVGIVSPTRKGQEVKLLIGESENKTLSKSGSVIRDEHPGSYFRELRKNFWVKNAAPDPGSGIYLTLEPGMKNSNPG
jgi:hypothetical protein